MNALRLAAVLVLVLVAALSLVTAPAGAQGRDKVPHWKSLRFDTVRMRVGPSREYRIAWVYQRRGLPLKVVRLREGWMLVEDAQGTTGWISASQLTSQRTAIVTGTAPAALRETPDPGSALRWRAEPGVVGKLLRCREDWCEIDVAGRTGWVRADRLWGDEELPGDS